MFWSDSDVSREGGTHMMGTSLVTTRHCSPCSKCQHLDLDGAEAILLVVGAGVALT